LVAAFRALIALTVSSATEAAWKERVHEYLQGGRLLVCR